MTTHPVDPAAASPAAAIPAASATRPASLDAVLAYAWTADEFTATDAMVTTGHTRSTTIDALGSLISLGLLRELPNAREAGDYRKGRPARRFALRAEAAAIVAVDAGNVHVTVTVADLRARPLATERIRLQPDRDEPAARRALIAAAVDRALGTAGRSRTDVLVVSVGVAAPVDAAGRSPRHPTGFWERMNPGLIDEFAWAPLVRIENDASLAAVAEGASGSAVGCRNYIALLAGGRFGAGVVVDGHLLRGAHGGVGEMVALDHVEGVGNAEGLGARAAKWAAEAVADGEVDPRGPLARLAPARLDGRAVLDLATRGDADAARIAERTGVLLARIVSVLGSMFDPQRIVVSGAIADGAEVVVAAARAALPTDLDLPAPELVVSRLGADVVVTGALAAGVGLARERALDIWAREPVAAG